MEAKIVAIGNSKGVRISKSVLREMSKRTPALVVSPDEMNRGLGTVIVRR